MKQFGLMASGASMALAVAALCLTACNPPHPHAKAPLKTVSTLDCPESEGDLNRKSASADGKSCLYAGEDGAQVTLTLVALDGKDARAALEPIEAQLKTEVPAISTNAAPTPSAKGGVEKDGDRVNIDLPGIHIHANGDHHTDVDATGVHVEAHDGNGRDGDRATVRIGGGDGAGVNINANDGGAQIRIEESGSGVRARYILASEKAGPHGYKVVGYEARGPKEGPIVVATLLSKSDDHDAMRHDIHRLIERNVGG